MPVHVGRLHRPVRWLSDQLAHGNRSVHVDADGRLGSRDVEWRRRLLRTGLRYATITAANGDTLDQSESGTVCEVGATAANAPHTFTGTYTNTGGTGRFADATGGGTVTGGDDGSGNSSYRERGTISY